MSLAGLFACREFLYRCDIELCGLVGINNFLRVQKKMGVQNGHRQVGWRKSRSGQVRPFLTMDIQRKRLN